MYVAGTERMMTASNMVPYACRLTVFVSMQGRVTRLGIGVVVLCFIKIGYLCVVAGFDALGI